MKRCGYVPIIPYLQNQATDNGQDLASRLLTEVMAEIGLRVSSRDRGLAYLRGVMGSRGGCMNVFQAHLAKTTRATQPLPPPRDQAVDLGILLPQGGKS